MCDVLCPEVYASCVRPKSPILTEVAVGMASLYLALSGSTRAISFKSIAQPFNEMVRAALGERRSWQHGLYHSHTHLKTRMLRVERSRWMRLASASASPPEATWKHE